MNARQRTASGGYWSCFLVALTLAGGWACSADGPAAEVSAEALAAVRHLSDEYARAWLADDTAAVMDLFTDNAVLVPHQGNPHAVGQSAIRDHFWPAGSRPTRVIRFDRQSVEVRGSGGIAWDRGTHTLTFVYDGDTLGNSGNYLAIAERAPDGRWRWAAYTWNHR